MPYDFGFNYRFEPGKNGSTRTLLVLHGTGGDENSLVPLGQAIYPDAAILSPRGKVMEGNAPRFFRRLAEGVFDLEDVQVRANELAEFVEAACVAHSLDRAQVFAVGYSNGANIAAAAMLLRPEVLAGGLLFRAMVTIEPGTPPDLTGRRIFLSEGEHDPLVSRANADHLASMLRHAGAEVEVRWNSVGHELTRREVDVAAEWLAR